MLNQSRPNSQTPRILSNTNVFHVSKYAQIEDELRLLDHGNRAQKTSILLGDPNLMRSGKRLQLMTKLVFEKFRRAKLINQRILLCLIGLPKTTN